MKIRESLGVFQLAEPVEPEWRDSWLPSALTVMRMELGVGADLWALAQSRARRDRPRATFLGQVRQALRRQTTPLEPPVYDPNMVPILGYGDRQRSNVDSFVLLSQPDVGWTTEARFAGPMDSLALLRDGTLAVGGAGVLALRSPAGEWAAREAPARLTCIWGTGAHCVHALGETEHGRGPLGKTGIEATTVSSGLFYFDGEAWTTINLAQRSIPGFFVDGACDREGYGWIVGTYATHSCIARGKGTEWERDGCSSWYLYHVHVNADGDAYALGGDGLWHHHTAYGWQQVEAFGREIGWPLALGTVQGRPWAIDARNLAGRMDRQLSAVGLFMGGLWVRIVLPERWRTAEAPATFAIAEDGEVLVGSGRHVWRSPSLRRIVPDVWPPARITPAEDPQLSSSEPLVPAWEELPGSGGLRQWGWCGDGIIGALGRSKWSVLAHWPRLSDSPETLAELDFDPGSMSVTPEGTNAALIPTEVDERGVYRSARRVVLIDLSARDVRETALPSEFEYSELGTDVLWSPDGSRFLVEPRKLRAAGKGRVLLVFRADDLALERELAIPEDAHSYRWDDGGIVLHYEALHAAPFSSVSAARLDPTTGELRRCVDRQNVSPNGQYRVALRGTTIEVTTIADGTVRELEPTPGGLLDTVDRLGTPRVLGARWVGNRLELSARMLGPVHLDLETLSLHYALPPRAEGEQAPEWSSDGQLALRPGLVRRSPRGSGHPLWEWGEVRTRAP